MMARGTGVARKKRASETKPRQAGPSRKARIIHLSAEYWPYIRTGGLGEAVRGMATFQSFAGSEVTVLLPLFQRIREADYGLKPVRQPLHRSHWPSNGARTAMGGDEGNRRPTGPLPGKRRLLRPIRSIRREGSRLPGQPPPVLLPDRGCCPALPEITPGPDPVLLHMHDWHTALAVVYLRTLGKGDPFADEVATVLSVHNGGFQGHFPPEVLAEMGLPFELYHMDVMEWYGRANVLKAGLIFTDMATTVSPSHSFELRTEDGGFGLHHTFLGLHDRLVGVLNGIDNRIWDPRIDPDIPANYSAEDLSGKATVKRRCRRSTD